MDEGEGEVDLGRNGQILIDAFGLPFTPVTRETPQKPRHTMREGW